MRTSGAERPYIPDRRKCDCYLKMSMRLVALAVVDVRGGNAYAYANRRDAVAHVARLVAHEDQVSSHLPPGQDVTFAS